jgi:hypothetical protein
VIGVVFDEFGFEVLHRTFAGNRSDCKTLPEMAQALHRASVEDHLVAPEPPTVVVDGGLATKANLADLRRLGFHYLVNDKRARRKTWLDLFGQTGFSPVPGRTEALEVLAKQIDLEPDDTRGLETDERIVLCKSRGRRNKELAIRSRAEDGFQTVKSDLGLRPAFHQVERRVNAHVFITVLAYQILRFILHTLESKGDTRSWYTLRHVLATHCYATIHLPLRNGTVHRIRKPGRPEQCQWDIYRKLGINTMSHLPSSRTVQPARTQEPITPAAKKSVVT